LQFAPLGIERIILEEIAQDTIPQIVL
jgi:hypothetical protein